MNRLFIILLVINLSHQVCAQPAHQLSSNAYVMKYKVAGPFHHDEVNEQNWIELLEIEFLNELEFNENDDQFKTVEANQNGILNFNEELGDSAQAVAYAYFNLYADEATDAMLLIEAQDGAKVVVNGSEVHTYFGGEWGSDNSADCTIKLKAGKNTVLLKVPNKDWGWNLSIKALDLEHALAYSAEQNEKSEYFQFLHTRFRPKMDNNSSYGFSPGKFPELVFDVPQVVTRFLGGNYQMKVRWFDRELREVTYPKYPGRYGFYAEAIGNNGLKVRKSGTLFCAPTDWMAWNEKPVADLEFIKINDIPEEVWKTHNQAIKDYVGFDQLKNMLNQEEGVILLSFLDEMHKQNLTASKTNTPIILDGDFQVKIKQKVLGYEGKFPELKLPKQVESMPLILGEKLPKSFYDRMEILCQAWMSDEGAPFDMVLAQNGKILFQDSYGVDEYGQFTTNTPSEIASITKLMTGLLFAQFVDQGLINIDDPVGDYLPDFPTVGPQALTLRHCFTHTSGFYGHGLFGGVHNPWLDNSLFHLIKEDTVGTQHNYNGMGYDLAGKVMEVVSGKSIFRLFREYLYEPLGMDNTYHEWDLGYSIHSTAMDMAKAAQMLLNKGIYNGKQFFSESTYQQMLPKPLSEFYPNIKQKWGIGITMMSWKVKDEESGKEHYLLSDQIIGHGSATASVFWVDLKNNIVLTQSRRRGNRNFGKHFQKVVELIEEYLVNDKT